MGSGGQEPPRMRRAQPGELPGLGEKKGHKGLAKTGSSESHAPLEQGCCPLWLDTDSVEECGGLWLETVPISVWKAPGSKVPLSEANR